MNSFPMYLRDMLDSYRSRLPDGEWPNTGKGRLARFLHALTPDENLSRRWTWPRRFCMQTLMLTMSLHDYGSAFRMLAMNERQVD